MALLRFYSKVEQNWNKGNRGPWRDTHQNFWPRYAPWQQWINI
jgi:hypothetical protein